MEAITKRIRTVRFFINGQLSALLFTAYLTTDPLSMKDSVKFPYDFGRRDRHAAAQ